jgi:CubicO group peptidase (beta-lactamase class C family)
VRRLSALLALLVAPAFASTTNSSVPLTAQDAAAFLDGMLPTGMAMGDIAGAVVVIVKDDQVLVSKGYGLADVARRIAVSPERTMFRPASVSKLFVWTAVMQQVEAGRLDLDANINRYLDFSIEGFGGQPITLRHLMTHTAGFEECLRDLLLDDPKALQSLEVVVKENIPARIFPPGTLPAYSNYGAALAGYIVQRVSGEPFADYVERHIFQPLHMSHSTFRQPVPAPLNADLSQGYLQASGAVVPFEISSKAPAGALSASGLDMAQFMLAHLNAGMIPALGESSRILQSQTVESMHAVVRRTAPDIDAMALGFYEQNRNGVRTIAHGGDLAAFHTDLILIPSARVGLYVSFNTVGKSRAAYSLRTALFEAFMDRYFPRIEPMKTRAITTPGAQTRDALGRYELSRRSASNLFSFAYLFDQIDLISPGPGVLVHASLVGISGVPKRFREVAPDLWREEQGEMQVAAVRSSDNKVRYLAADGYGPVFVFQLVPGYRDRQWLVPVIWAAGMVLAAAAAFAVVSMIRRRRTRGWVSNTLSAAGVSGLVFLALGYTLVTLSSGDSTWIFSSAAMPFIRVIQLSALLALLTAGAAVAAAIRSWSLSTEPARTSMARTLICMACLVLAYVVLTFHFLTLRLDY